MSRPILARLDAESAAIAGSTVLKDRLAAIFTEMDVRDSAGFTALLPAQRQVFAARVRTLDIRGT